MSSQSSQLRAKFEVTNWDEVPFDDDSVATKITEATVSRTYTGDIDATSVTKWLMAYKPDQTATFVGLERLTGTAGGREGTLVLRHVGSFENGAATAALTVISGTGQLESASGQGDFIADPAGAITLDLDPGDTSAG